MIVLTRRQIRRLRVVFRRSALGLDPRSSVPPLVLREDGGRVRIDHRHDGLAVRCRLAVRVPRGETVVLPLDALLDLEGADESPVVLEARGDRTCARWEVGGVPQARLFDVPGPAAGSPAPPDPAPWFPAPGALLAALAEAVALGESSPASGPPGPGGLWLRGGGGTVVAAAAGWILIQSGFAFPWRDDVALGRLPVWTSWGGPRARPCALGRADGRVAVRAGRWTVVQAIPAGAPPPPDLPAPRDPAGPRGRVRLGPAESRTLARLVARGAAAGRPVRIDLDPDRGVTLSWPGGHAGRAARLVAGPPEATGAGS
jgi:hypothetical protein